ncbi:flagellar basal body-associated protein FliL [compost metagenome]
MFKNKAFILIISILIAITLILTAAFVLWNFMEKGSASADPTSEAKTAADNVKPTKQPAASEIKANTVNIKEIVTNIGNSGRFIKLSLAFELENSKGKEEFDNLVESQVKGTIIQTLSDLTPEQAQGSKGQDFLTSALMNKLNPMLQKGKIKKIWLTEYLLQ